MLSHWFADQQLDDEQRAILRYALAPGSLVTPAFLEGLCAEHDDVQTLLQALERRADALWNSKGRVVKIKDEGCGEAVPQTPPQDEGRPRKRGMWGKLFR